MVVVVAGQLHGPYDVLRAPGGGDGMLKVRVFSGRKQTSAEFDTAVLDACQAKYRAWLARNEAAFRTLTVVDIQGTDEVKCVRPDWYMTISASIIVKYYGSDVE